MGGGMQVEFDNTSILILLWSLTFTEKTISV